MSSFGGSLQHPDAAWSPNCYIGPRGLDNEPCRHFGQRMRIGPYSQSKTFMLLVDKCGWCGHILRTAEDVSWQEYIWLRRSNARTVSTLSATESKTK